jgi:hypothetical protein
LWFRALLDGGTPEVRFERTAGHDRWLERHNSQSGTPSWKP